MINTQDILETINMIRAENLDIRTITMGISLLSCADSDIHTSCDKIYEKICRQAEHLVKTGENIEKEYGIPIIHKRISVTPIAMLGGKRRRPRSLCENIGESCADGRREFHRRLFYFRCGNGKRLGVSCA